MAKKTSRKELREPDEFISFTTKALEWASEQKFALIMGASALALVIVGSYAFRWYQISKDKVASADFFRAKEVMDAPVIPDVDETEGVPLEETFKTYAEKYENALTELEQVYKAHEASHVAMLATYFIGELDRKLGKFEEAISHMKKYLNEEGEEGELAAFAWEGIAASLEAQGKLSEAREQYRRLTEPPFDTQSDRGLYHLARLEQMEGKEREAARMFGEILEKYPKTLYRQEIQARMSRLPPVGDAQKGSSESGADQEADEPAHTEGSVDKQPTRVQTGSEEEKTEAGDKPEVSKKTDKAEKPEANAKSAPEKGEDKN